MEGFFSMIFSEKDVEFKFKNVWLLFECEFVRPKLMISDGYYVICIDKKFFGFLLFDICALLCL